MDQPAPEQGLIPYLTVDDAETALDFYARAFGAVETLRLRMGDKIGHAEMQVAGARFMLSGEWPPMNILSPKSRGGATSAFSIYVPDADAAYAHAVEAGATPQRPPTDEFYGDRVGMVTDPFGHRWSLHTHQRDVSEADMQKAMDAFAASMPTKAEAEAHPS